MKFDATSPACLLVLHARGYEALMSAGLKDFLPPDRVRDRPPSDRVQVLPLEPQDFKRADNERRRACNQAPFSARTRSTTAWKSRYGRAPVKRYLPMRKAGIPWTPMFVASWKSRMTVSS